MSRKRVNSVHVQSEIMQAATKKVNPPAFMPLSKEERKFFDIITRARLEWTQIDLVMAVHLARCFHEINTLQAALDQEGFVIGDKVNPKAQILEVLSRRSLSLSRAIHVHAGATLGRARDQQNKNSAFRRAQEAMDEDDLDSLIARPTEH